MSEEIAVKTDSIKDLVGDKPSKKKVQVTLETIYELLNERLPEKSKLLSLEPRTKDQAITALQNILEILNGSSNNIKVAKTKIETAIQLIKQEK